MPDESVLHDLQSSAARPVPFYGDLQCRRLSCASVRAAAVRRRRYGVQAHPARVEAGVPAPKIGGKAAIRSSRIASVLEFAPVCNTVAVGIRIERV